MERLSKTVGGIGAAILAKRMKDNPGEAKNLGYYTESNKTFKGGKTRRSKTLKSKKGIEEIFSGILYGGRNEVYMRGYIPDCTVFDYDLRSAYGTVQTTIGQFDFSNPILFYSAGECFKYLTENAFSFGRVYAEKWRHKPECRYPVLIHKVNDAGVFTRETEQYWMSSFEFLAAYNSFSEITGFYGVIYPRISSTSVISEFQSDIGDRRNMARGRDEFKEKFMKLIANSTYGKFAQGYSGKNTLNLKKSRKGDLVTGVIPKSQISNSFIAVYITSLVRAIAFEILNYLQDNLSTRPLYWTTDGFAVTQAVPDEIIEGNFGIISRAVADHVERIRGKREIFEKKHTGRGWLSIKTRAYTMLERSGKEDLLSSITGVQFKGSTNKKAKFIESEFRKLERFKDTKYPQNRITSMLEWLTGEEYRNIEEERSFNFDFDFKRLADLKTIFTKNGFLYFETIPFDNIHVFARYKDHYENFQRGRRTKEEDPRDRKQFATKNKIVTEKDFREFFQYTNAKNIQLKTEKDKSLSTIKREHLRILANFIKYKATKKLGFKNIAKILKVPQDTVRHWTTVEFQILHRKQTLEYLIDRFELDFLKPKDRDAGVICESFNTYIFTSILPRLMSSIAFLNFPLIISGIPFSSSDLPILYAAFIGRISV